MTAATQRVRRWIVVLVAALGAVLVLAALVVWLNLRGEAPLRADGPPTANAEPAVLARGAYLARAGNCAGCHTAPGGAAWAGGRGIETPFGTVYAPNITPDADTGIGSWSSDAFWRAMHHGRSKDGRLLYPAFPYPSYTALTRDDSDALYAFLRSAAPARQPNKRHALGFPFGTQAALAVWRAMFFRAGGFAADPAHDAAWHRGRYLVEALGHCAACHSGRNALGGTRLNARFAGGLMPDGAWYAPSLADPQQAGVQGWPAEDVVQLLQSGISPLASVAGPMADVVDGSTQHLTGDDLRAMASFLAAIPVQPHEAPASQPASADTMRRGATIYGTQCAGCHGDKGQGVPQIYPALAGNRAVTLELPNNVVQLIRHGGFAPSTAGNPQPFGMPPFAQALGNDDVAAVATYIRQSWGNAAPPVSPLEVLRIR